MNPKEFVKGFLPFARDTETKTGISAIAILAQAALESGWGKYAPGNMFFGVKDHDGINGNEQLVVTTEYSRRADLKFPVILSVMPCIVNGQKYFKYVVKDYFRKYETPEESFTDHTKVFFNNPRYSEALKVKGDYESFLKAIAPIYATAPDYASTVISIAHSISKLI